jgi:hypothetical protein
VLAAAASPFESATPLALNLVDGDGRDFDLEGLELSPGSTRASELMASESDIKHACAVADVTRETFNPLDQDP